MLRLFDFQMAPLILGVALGPFLETYLRQGLSLSRGSVGDLVAGSPIALVVWCLTALVAIGSPLTKAVLTRRSVASRPVG